MSEAVTYEAKLKAGKYLVPVKIVQEDKRLFFHFGYNKPLLEEIKMMEGRKWHGYDEHNPRKVWSVPTSQRNLFQLSYLCGNNPYAPYDTPLMTVTSERPFRDYQYEMTAHFLTRHYAIVAGEMGLGKSLSAIEAIEQSGAHGSDWLYVAPSSALESIKLELDKWSAKVRPSLMTYEGMKKLISEWPIGKLAPRGVVFDECSRVKNMTAQRTQAAKHLADSIRTEHGPQGYVWLMSGTPAPKSPADWWALAEIACPGFLKEGDIHKFRERLGIIIQKETSPGAGSYPHLVTWRDDENKCNVCGELKEHRSHDLEFGPSVGVEVHQFEKSVNEVLYLYKRLQGLVLVKLKKHCLSLPEKQYEIIHIKPTQSVLNAAKLIKRVAKTTVGALTLLRELSDGFQYEKIDAGTETCPLCKGGKTCIEYFDKNDSDNVIVDKTEGLEQRTVACVYCDATGEVVKQVRDTQNFASAKDKVVRDLLDKHDDVGRFVIYGGFQGSIDKIVETCQNLKWNYIRVDSRGWITDVPGVLTRKEMLLAFQGDTYDKIVFIGQPGAAGMGLTLTASPGILYYSNSFDGEARIQSEDRIHRLGMDENRGATIYDIVHLPSDQLVLDNLKKKRKLQDMSLGELDLLDWENGDARVL